MALSDAETCRSDIRLYLYTSKVQFCVVNENLDPIKMQEENSGKE